MFGAVATANRETFDLRELVKPALVVSEHTPLDELLATMKRERTHLAIVADEHGGTAGLVSIGDLLERIVGDVDDAAEVGPLDFEGLAGGGHRLSGLVSIEEVEERLGIEIDENYYNTIAGYLFGQLGQRPSIGDEVIRDGTVFRVSAMDGLRIDRVDLIPVAPVSASDPVPTNQAVDE